MVHWGKWPVRQARRSTRSPRMKDHSLLRTVIVGFICAVPAYWFNAYSQMTLLGIHIYWILALLVLVASGWIYWAGRMSVIRVVVALCAGVMLGVAARIGFDVIRDPTTHNLLPFEILAALIITALSALTGTFLAGVGRRIMRG